jgi:hypothetical protein
MSTPPPGEAPPCNPPIIAPNSVAPRCGRVVHACGDALQPNSPRRIARDVHRSLADEQRSDRVPAQITEWCRRVHWPDALEELDPQARGQIDALSFRWVPADLMRQGRQLVFILHSFCAMQKTARHRASLGDTRRTAGSANPQFRGTK